MTQSQALAALRRAFIPALVAALLTAGLLAAALALRPDSYSARVGIAAEPVVQVEPGGAPGYASVVNLMMAAVPEVALSAPVLDQARARIPGMDSRLLERSVTVEVVPGSGVARIETVGDTPELASALLDVVLQEISQSNLLTPVGTFRVLGDARPQPTPTGADRLLVVGLCAAAAALVGLLTIAALQAVRPRLLTRSDVEEVVRSVDSGPVPVVVLGRGSADLDLVASRAALAVPGLARVHALSAEDAADDDLAEAVNQRLQSRSLTGGSQSATGTEQASGRHSGGETGTEAALVTVRLRRTTPDQLSAALLKAEARGETVAAVVARAH